MKKIIVIFLINLISFGSAVAGSDGEDSLSKKSEMDEDFWVIVNSN